MKEFSCPKCKIKVPEDAWCGQKGCPFSPDKSKRLYFGGRREFLHTYAREAQTAINKLLRQLKKE